WGFGLRDIGYYFPISDYMDLELTGDIYFKGSWGLRVKSNYRKRYRFSGGMDLGFSNRIQEIVDAEGQVVNNPQRSFSITWSHSQDSRAHPNRSFNASVRMQTNGFDQRNYNDADRVLQSQYTSNVSYRKTFQGTPFSLSANISHSQNTQTRDMQFTLPDLNVKMNRIFPFQNNKRRSPKQKWYEKISLQYNGKFVNRLRTKDTLLLQEPILDKAEFGFNHDLNSSASFRLFKYFSITPSVNYEESWYFKTIQKTFDPDFESRLDTVYNADSSDFVVMTDTLTFGDVLTDTLRNFRSLREYTASVSLSTQIFGTLAAGRRTGWFRGVRHVIKPSISFNFSPDYSNPDLGYVDFVQTDIRRPDDLDEYSVFESALFGSPPRGGKRMALSYSITNLIEAKIFSKRDSTEKKLKLFNNISVTGSYNFVADSLRFSMINMSGNTSLFGGLSRLSFRARFDPYDINEFGRRVDNFYLNTKGKILRFEDANVRLSTGLTIDEIRKLAKGESLQRGGGRNRQQQRDAEVLAEESILDVVRSFRLNHDLVLMWDVKDGKTKLDVRTNSINTRGNIPITPRWNIRVGNIGYDFNSKRLTYPSFGFNRDLHCWEMGFDWAPQRRTYSFYIRVRQSPLNFIRIPYTKGTQDSGFRPR
ncbi:MAG: putative LPS assembly protein LptD, partial [Saprospiraceae bacterium]|nr:putative LPS assembly protein LptD [Saprospiraceae bacterium]